LEDLDVICAGLVYDEIMHKVIHFDMKQTDLYPWISDMDPDAPALQRLGG
jgi:hypothetical protein